jgi:hypothetical protein
MHILPAAPHGTTDQMSPDHAAVPRPLELGTSPGRTRPDGPDEPTDQESRLGPHTGHAVGPQPGIGGRFVSHGDQPRSHDHTARHSLQAGVSIARASRGRASPWVSAVDRRLSSRLFSVRERPFDAARYDFGTQRSGVQISPTRPGQGRFPATPPGACPQRLLSLGPLAGLSSEPVADRSVGGA